MVGRKDGARSTKSVKSETVPLVPASTSLATAMYPPQAIRSPLRPSFTKVPTRMNDCNSLEHLIEIMRNQSDVIW